MKKITIVILLLAMSPLLAARDGKFFAASAPRRFFPGDGRFKELYGNVQVSPELTVGYHLYRNFYFWLGGSFISASGVIPVLEEKIKATQTFISLGAGWETRRGRRLQADLGAALLLAGFREKAMGDDGEQVGSRLRRQGRAALFSEGKALPGREPGLCRRLDHRPHRGRDRRHHPGRHAPGRPAGIALLSRERLARE